MESKPPEGDVDIVPEPPNAVKPASTPRPSPSIVSSPERLTNLVSISEGHDAPMALAGWTRMFAPLFRAISIRGEALGVGQPSRQPLTYAIGEGLTGNQKKSIQSRRVEPYFFEEREKQMKFAKLLAVVFALFLGAISVHAQDAQGMRQEYFQRVTASVYKDFGACVNFYMTQYDFVGWARWKDGSYIIIFQNEPPRADDTDGGGLWGNDGPGISFHNIRGFNRRTVHALATPMPGYGFGVRRGKYAPWTFDIMPTGRANLNLNDLRFHPAGCIS